MVSPLVCEPEILVCIWRYATQAVGTNALAQHSHPVFGAAFVAVGTINTARIYLINELESVLKD